MGEFEYLEIRGNWFVTPEGDLLNFDNIEYIAVRDEQVNIYTTGHNFTFKLNADWKKFLHNLPEKLVSG